MEKSLRRLAVPSSAFCGIVAVAAVLTSANLAKAQPPATTQATVGSVVAFAGPTNRIPINWMVCDGRRLSRATHPALFNAVGTSWGGDGAPAFFIPDLRGMFLRGVDKNQTGSPTNPARDSGRDQRDAPKKNESNPGSKGNAGNNVGSVQDDQLQTHHHDAAVDGDTGGHSHPVTINRSNIAGSNRTRDVDEGEDKLNADPDAGSISASIPEDTGRHSHPVSVTNPKDSKNPAANPAKHGAETRPKNAYVYWIIRAK